MGDGEAQLVQDQADQGLVDPVCAGMQPQRAAELEPDGDEKGRKPLAPDNPRPSRVTAGSQNTTCEAARGHRPRGSAGNRRIAITSAWWFGTDIHDPPACAHRPVHTNAWLILIELASSCLLHHGSCVTADLIFEVRHMSEPAGKLFGEQRLRSEWHSCPGLKRTA